MSLDSLVSALALIGIVILVASLLSGLVERTGVPQVAIFLLLGAMLGPAGLNLVNLTLQSPTLQWIAILALVLVLFTDAIAMDLSEIRRPRRVLLLVLGPATLLPAILIAVAAHFLLGLDPIPSAILGAALASTDPVMLRNLFRRSTLPPDVRAALKLESGVNDVVLLPIIVLSILLSTAPGGNFALEMSRHAVGLFVLGPMLGALIGYVAITVLEQVRKRVGVRRDYESLYALGCAFTAYAAAEAVGGSGFLAAFAAGVVISSLDVELCDCFLDYGQATAEMFLLFTFVAFGAWLIWSGFTVADGRTVLFALVALVMRTLVLYPVLAREGIDRRTRRIVAWSGPRGLSSLLLILLPVFAGVPGSERLFAITCLVVLLSVALHGTGIALFLRNEGPTSAPVRMTGAAVTHEPDPDAKIPEKITLEEFQKLRDSGKPYVLADVRTERSYRADNLRAQGAIRLPPDDAVRRARELGLEHHATVVLYCA
ncbi:MAG TPA: cation:proton antiporter [Gemmatimonadales bacterium]|jgi:NhaP-type Na+/H+ or K+/H+ antiporter|nr:cation:proton antiporter [Gemmatimonadales bacterium]